MKAYKIMARSGTTRVQRQDLTGGLVTNLELAWRLAEQLAHKQAGITNRAWTAEVTEYVVGTRPGA